MPDIKSIEIVGCGVVITFADGWRLTIEGEAAKKTIIEATKKVLNGN